MNRFTVAAASSALTVGLLLVVSLDVDEPERPVLVAVQRALQLLAVGVFVHLSRR